MVFLSDPVVKEMKFTAYEICAELDYCYQIPNRFIDNLLDVNN
jgi:hypothetical protein